MILNTNNVVAPLSTRFAASGMYVATTKVYYTVKAESYGEIFLGKEHLP